MQHLPLRLVRQLLLGAFVLVIGAPAALAAPDDPPTAGSSKRGGDGVGGIEKGAGGSSKGPSAPVGQRTSGSGTQFDTGPVTWLDLGWALPGTTLPSLSGTGDGSAGSTLGIHLAEALPFTPVTLVVGSDSQVLPFKGGALVPIPMLLVNLFSDASGSLNLQVPMPLGLPPGTTLCMQMWMLDPLGPKGLSATNGLLFVAQ